jgi:hypothetical protein
MDDRFWAARAALIAASIVIVLLRVRAAEARLAVAGALMGLDPGALARNWRHTRPAHQLRHRPHRAERSISRPHA